MQTEPSTQDITTVLAEVASAVVGQLDMKSLLPKILDTTMNTLHADVCSIFLKDDNDPDTIHCKAGSGFAEKLVNKAKYKKGEGFTGTVFKEGEVRNVKNRIELEQGTWTGMYDSVQWPDGRNQFRNMLALPLKIKGDILGVIKVENKKVEYGEYFTDEEDLKIFTTIANVIALAIENARSHQRAEEQSRKITAALASVAGEVVGAFDMKKLLDKIINTTMTTLNAEVCSIFLKKEDNPDTIVCEAGSGFARRIIGKAEYKKGVGLTGKVFELGEEYNITTREQRDSLVKQGILEGKYDGLQWEGGKDEFRNLLALPLRIKDQILGVIKVENKIGKEPFTGEDLTVFRTIANVIALTIENAKLHQQIEANLKSISGKAAHRIGNLVINYDYLEMDFDVELSKSSSNNKTALEQLVGKMVEATKNLKRMLSEFRSYGRPLELKKELVDINELLQSEKAGTQTTEVVVTLHLDNQLPPFELDKAKFGESIRELLRNAKRAIEKSSKKAGKIDVTTRLTHESIEILIEDDGPGIADDFPLFTAFRSTNPESTGLGLVTVREQMRAYGGDIEHVKQADRGACFKITLPLKKSR